MTLTYLPTPNEPGNVDVYSEGKLFGHIRVLGDRWMFEDAQGRPYAPIFRSLLAAKFGIEDAWPSLARRAGR